jgi:hypothetical protein
MPKSVAEKLDEYHDRELREYLDTYPYEDTGFPDRVAELIKEEYELFRTKRRNNSSGR